MFRELFADGPARKQLFGLARSNADGTRKLFPSGPNDSVWTQQEYALHADCKKSGFGRVPTWNDLVDHTLDSKLHGSGDRLLVPISCPIKVSETRPRVAIELRRIGWGRLYAKDWAEFMRLVFSLTGELDF